MSTEYLDQVQTPVDDIYIALKLLATTLGDDASDRRVKICSSLLYIEIAIPNGRDSALVHTFPLTDTVAKELIHKHYLRKRTFGEYVLSPQGFETLRNKERPA
jgi:hypothetical protein